MASLDAVKLLAGGLTLTPHPGNGQMPLVVLQLDIVLGKSRQFHHHDVMVRHLEHVNRWRPARWPRGEAGHPLLNGQEVLKRIPAYESHGGIVPPSTPNSQEANSQSREPRARKHRAQGEPCATIERFCRRCLWLLYKQRDSKRACWSRWSRTCSGSSSSSM
jgi:hypothetical protein